MPSEITLLEEDLLAAIDGAEITRHAARLRDLAPVATGADPAESETGRAAYIQATVRGWGVPLTLHRFDALVSLPGAARFTLARRNAPVEALAHPGSAATPPGGLTAELRATAPTDDADLAGTIALLDGPPTPTTVAAIARRGAIGQVYVSPGDTPRPASVIGPDGSPSATPVIAIGHAAGEGFRALCAAGPTPVLLEASDAWSTRRFILPVASVGGVEEPDRFILAGADGDAPVAAAGLLELCRVLAQHQRRLRRGLRFAWWPAGGLPVAGATWYADHAWEDLGYHAAAYVDCVALGQRAADSRLPRALHGFHWFTEATLRDGGETGFASPVALPVGNAAPFARCGLPILALNAAPQPESAGEPPLAAITRDTALHALLLARLCAYPLLPYDLVATARAIEERIRVILGEGGEAVDLAPLPVRAAAFRAAAERFHIAALHIAQGLSTNYEEGLDLANRALQRLNRQLIPLLHHAGDPYCAAPAGASFLPGLETIPALGRLPDSPDPRASQQLRVTAIRERNRLTDALNAATTMLDEALSSLRPLGFG